MLLLLALLPLAALALLPLLVLPLATLALLSLPPLAVLPLAVLPLAVGALAVLPLPLLPLVLEPIPLRLRLRQLRLHDRARLRHAVALLALAPLAVLPLPVLHLRGERRDARLRQLRQLRHRRRRLLARQAAARLRWRPDRQPEWLLLVAAERLLLVGAEAPAAHRRRRLPLTLPLGLALSLALLVLLVLLAGRLRPHRVCADELNRPAEHLRLRAVGVADDDRSARDARPGVARGLREAVVRVRVHHDHPAGDGLRATQRQQPIEAVVARHAVLVGLDVAEVAHAPRAVLGARVPRVERVEDAVAHVVLLQAEAVLRVRRQPADGAVDQHAGRVLVEAD